jgi:hypothetical protein
MKFTQIPEDTFKTLQLNAGILLTTFDPSTGEYKNEDILGATTGGVQFSSNPTYSDYGEDIDNCPKNMKELKKLESWDVSITGNLLKADTVAAKILIGACDIDPDDTTHLVPRNDIDLGDFKDIWWVGDYGDENNDKSGGFVALRIFDALSTGGYSFKTTDKAKTSFAFTFTGHYSISNQSRVPFDVYVRAGVAEDTEEIEETGSVKDEDEEKEQINEA